MESGGGVRFAVFLGLAVCLALWERFAPRRAPEPGHVGRWVGNLGVVAISTVLVRLLFPVFPIGMALWAADAGWGVFSFFGLSYPVSVLAGLLVLDMALYFQHRAMHVWRPLWRVHRMHHADTFFDFTTGIRFHPLEFILSMAFKLAVIAMIGPPVLSVLLFEVLLNAAAMFNHANVRIPPPVDGWLRLVVVTPDMHRVHHSTDMREANSNFGFNFPWWDRLFGTYKAQPDLGHEGMRIGLNIFRGRQYRSLARLLAMPFLKGGR